MKHLLKKLEERFRNNSGFTLIELMIVITILGILAVVIVPNFLGVTDKAKVAKAKMEIGSISDALTMYNADNGTYPTTEQGLSALIEKPQSDPAPANYNENGYLGKKKLPKDPWGHDYSYKAPADNSEPFEITSFGPDGKEGTKDDINSTDLDAQSGDKKSDGK